MSNITIKTNLLKLNKAFVKKFKTKNGEMIDCVLIPIKLNHMFQSEKGVYLEAQAFEIREKKADSKDTHIMKQSLPKDIYGTMSQDDKDKMPIIGNCILWNGAPAVSPDTSNNSNYNGGGVTNGGVQPDDDDLPF